MTPDREVLFESPEDAAMCDFPAKYCRVVASRSQGDEAYVLLDTGSPGHPYLYGVYCSRWDGRWRGDGSSNGHGWAQTDFDRHLGTLVVWDLAPEGADRIRLEFNGQIAEEPVTDIAYLAVWWRVPDPGFRWPTVAGVRIRGTWKRSASRWD